MAQIAQNISIHALLAESDRHRTRGAVYKDIFLSTLSLRRATGDGFAVVDVLPISIHALLAESDIPVGWWKMQNVGFLSTLSLRRATTTAPAAAPTPANFYPRSPCGERRAGRGHVASRHQISIHALLAESDAVPTLQPWHAANFYPRSPCGERQNAHPDTRRPYAISIHALLAESDADLAEIAAAQGVFLSTLSLRRATKLVQDALYSVNISIHALLAESDCFAAQCRRPALYFYPRSPCGERLMVPITPSITVSFLSTLSLRRATPCKRSLFVCLPNFYPRSPCGERQAPWYFVDAGDVFLSTLSLRRATSSFSAFASAPVFLSTLSLRRATPSFCLQVGNGVDFYPRSPCGERRGTTPKNSTAQLFLSTLSLRRATVGRPCNCCTTSISIHALLAESDPVRLSVLNPAEAFLSTLSLRRATGR